MAVAKRPYLHLLRAMRPGDAIYLAETSPHLPRQVHAVVGRNEGEVSTKYFLATNLSPDTAHRVVRVTMVRALKPIGRGRRAAD